MKEQRIQSTDQYHLFKTITSNREVDRKHVKRLAQAISDQNLLHLNPIIVNSNMDVIDGQHRLAAAKQLRLPIYYVMDDEVGKNHIAKLNSNAKNWGTMDYVNYWTAEKRPGFAELARFVNKYGISVTGAVALLSDDANSKGNMKDLRDGMVDASNWDGAVQIIEFLQAIQQRYGYNWIINGGIAKALRRMWQHPEFAADTLRAKIDADPRKLVPCTSDKSYLVMLAEIYNYKLQYRIDFFSRRRKDDEE